MKVSIHWQDAILINIYVPNSRASKCMKHDILRGRNRQRNSNSWILHMTYSVMDRTRQKNHQIEDLNISINQLELIDIYITFHPTMIEYTFFSSAPEAFRRTDHELGHKMNLNKFY